MMPDCVGLYAIKRAIDLSSRRYQKAVILIIVPVKLKKKRNTFRLTLKEMATKV